VPVTVQSPAAQPDLHPRIASSAPLEASPPIRVDVPAVGVTAPIGPLGLNRDGTLEVPTNFARAGWYTGRPTPGEAGPAIIVAHRASRRGPGAFWKLPDVQPGQQIVVTRADNRRVLFAVERVEQHRKDAFPTAAVYGPTPETALRLITCGGPFEPALGDHYRDNVIVFARMTGWA
jgi:sortase (surface protein transpeptidase)